MALKINNNLTEAGKNLAGLATQNVSRRSYSSAYRYHHPHYHEHNHHFCHSCCHPVSKCCCGHKQCRKASKELLADQLDINELRENKEMLAKLMRGSMTSQSLFQSFTSFNAASIGFGKDIIGGGCCVHLSVEYMPENNNNTDKSMVIVMVDDAEDHTLAWAKESIQPGYHIKEDIITVNPGAKLVVITLNAIARVRWCEVFSC